MDETKNIVHYIQAKKTEVPNNEYFENLANIILEKHVEPTTKVIPFYRKPVFKWIAAAAVIVPFVFYFTLQGTHENQRDVLAGMKKIPKEDIHAYILENQNEFHIDEILEGTDLSIIDAFRSESVSLETSVNSSIFNGITKDEIESYFEFYYGDIDVELEELENQLFI